MRKFSLIFKQTELLLLTTWFIEYQYRYLMKISSITVSFRRRRALYKNVVFYSNSEAKIYMEFSLQNDIIDHWSIEFEIILNFNIWKKTPHTMIRTEFLFLLFVLFVCLFGVFFWGGDVCLELLSR